METFREIASFVIYESYQICIVCKVHNVFITYLSKDVTL